jgi:rfaE bifunctional protein kinase chain/domain
MIDILNRLPALSALVVGDICLDRWCIYDPAEAEPSRETGIPRIAVIATETTPGAGGTVANNLAAMGVGRVAVLGAVGRDGFGWELRQALEARRISSGSLLESDGIQTFTYTKLLRSDNQDEDRPRVDFINQRPLPSETMARLVDEVQNTVESFDVILVSDQAETDDGGVISAGMRDAIADLALAFPEKVFLVDSRKRVEHFRNVILKCNQDEANDACMRATGRLDYGALRQHAQAPMLVVTHGGDGALVITADGEEWIATKKVENPVDICGAGDSFSAGMAMALKATGSARRAVEFGNLVASITIMKKGTGTASPQELKHAYAGN